MISLQALAKTLDAASLKNTSGCGSLSSFWTILCAYDNMALPRKSLNQERLYKNLFCFSPSASNIKIKRRMSSEEEKTFKIYPVYFNGSNCNGRKVSKELCVPQSPKIVDMAKALQNLGIRCIIQVSTLLYNE